MKGLTLIEVLVAMGIATVAGALLIAIIVSSAGLFSNQLPKVQEGLNINDALSLVRNTTKQAGAVSNQYIDGSTVYTSGVNELVLQAASIDSSNNIIEGSTDYFVFFLDQGFLRFKIFPDPSSLRKGADRILLKDINSLVFKYFASSPPTEVDPQDANKVKITLVLQSNIATAEANLRND